MIARDLLRGGGLAGDGALLPAAAIALLEDGEPGAGLAAAESVADPALRFVLTSAAQARHPSGEPDRLVRLVELAGTVPDLGAALTAAEPYLARVDPRWAAGLPARLGIQPPAYGLDVAALRDDGPIEKVPGSAFERQLRADAVARLATRGALRDRDDPWLEPLREINRLYPDEAASYLVAAACVDSAWALEIADAVLERYPPGGLIAALRLVAIAAVAAGHGAAISERAAKHDFLTNQATWYAVACHAGALADPTELAAELVPRVGDELDEDDELLASLPLLEGLAHAGAIDELRTFAEELDVAAALVIDRLFTSGASAAATRLELTGGLPAQDRDLGWGLSWWPAGGTAEERAAACRSAIAVAASPPWWPLPGTLPDLTNWTQPAH